MAYCKSIRAYQIAKARELMVFKLLVVLIEPRLLTEVEARDATVIVGLLIPLVVPKIGLLIVAAGLGPELIGKILSCRSAELLELQGIILAALIFVWGIRSPRERHSRAMRSARYKRSISCHWPSTHEPGSSIGLSITNRKRVSKQLEYEYESFG